VCTCISAVVFDLSVGEKRATPNVTFFDKTTVGNARTHPDIHLYLRRGKLGTQTELVAYIRALEVFFFCPCTYFCRDDMSVYIFLYRMFNRVITK